jgi:hypothetical protein
MTDGSTLWVATKSSFDPVEAEVNQSPLWEVLTGFVETQVEEFLKKVNGYRLQKGNGHLGE